MRRLAILGTIITVILAGCADSSTPAQDEDEVIFEDIKVGSGLGAIRGVVVDTAITPVAEVDVTVVGQDLVTQTDEEGRFQFIDVAPGVYNLDIKKLGWGGVRQSVQVEADVADPPIVRILIEADPSELPTIQPVQLKGRLTCGVAVVVTSVGCTTYGPVAEQIGDQSVFSQDYTTVPDWVQGELIWESTQLLSGDFIWEIVQSEYPGSPQPHIGYRETTASPALAYLDSNVTAEYADWILEKGLDWRFFGGPHELTRGVFFGVGVTLEQDVEIIIHEFYNMVPDEGWRFTRDGDHPIPV